MQELAVGSLQANGSLSTVLKTVQVITDAYKASYSLIGSRALLNHTTNSSASTTTYSVLLPESPTAVTLSLSGSSATGTATALLIAAAELPSTQFVSLGTNTSNISVSAALPPPQLISSVVSIQVFQVSTNGTVKPSILPYFEASLTVSQSTNTSTSAASALVHNCSTGTFEQVSFYCQEAKVRLNLTCSGKASAQVRRQCPVPRTVCSVVNLADNSIVSNDFCRTVSVGSTVLCKCGIEGDTAAAANVSSLALTGKISVGAFRVYGSGSLTASVAIANSIPVSALAAKSMMIFASFGCIWGVGLILLALSTRSMVHAKARAKAPGGTSEGNQGSNSGSSRSGQVQALLDLILPAYYTSTVKNERRSWLPQRWWHVMRACHPYVRMITAMTQSAAGSSAGEERIFILDVIHSLTALTMACFLLALLYDFQYPEDDGSCAAQTTAATCLVSKMLLDPTESQCIWHPPTTVETGNEADRIVITEILNGQVVDTIPITRTEDIASSGYCTFNGSNNSSLAFVLSFLITALFANLFSMFLERCMVVLNAQSSERSSSPVCHRASEPATTLQSLDRSLSKERRQAMEFAATLRSYPVEGVESLRSQLAASLQALDHQRRMNSHPSREQAALQRLSPPLKGIDGFDADDGDIEMTQTRSPEAAAVVAATQCVSPPRHLSLATWQALQAASPTDLAVMMLRAAVTDVVALSAGRESLVDDREAPPQKARRQATYRRHVFHLAVERAFPPVAVIGHLWVWQAVVATTLVMLNGGALYFIISKAAVRGYDWQVSFLKIAAWEWFSDVVLMQGCEVWLFDYYLCGLVWNDVQAARQQLDTAADWSTVGAEVSPVRSSSSSSTMMTVTATDALLVTEMIDWFPSLPEALWMWSLSYHSTAGGKGPPSREGSSSTVQSTSSKSTWALWMHHRTLYVLSWLPLDGWIGVESFAAPLLLAWIIYLYYIYVAPAWTEVSTVDIVVLVVVLVVAALAVAGLVVYHRAGQRVQPHDTDVIPDHVATTALPLPPLAPPLGSGRPMKDDSSSETGRSCAVESVAYLEVDAVDKEADLDAIPRVERERFYSSVSNSSRWCFSETFTDILVNDEADDDNDDEEVDAATAEHRSEPARARFYSETSGSWMWSGSEEDDEVDQRRAEPPGGSRRQSSSPSSASSSTGSASDSRDSEASLPFSMSWSSHGSVARPSV